jgi:hypothetical protein
MKKTIGILANSIRRGCHCIAGRELTQRDSQWYWGGWVRPVSSHGEGEVSHRECRYANGSLAAVLDMVEIEFTAPQPAAHQPENWVIDASHRWQKVGTLSTGGLPSVVEEPAHLWFQRGTRTDRIHQNAAPSSLAPFQSLFLIMPRNLRFKIWTADDPFRDGPRKHRRALFAYGNVSYDLPITDPTMEQRYFSPFPAINQPERVIQAPAGTMLVVSLAAAFKDGYHYKVVATVLETQ